LISVQPDPVLPPVPPPVPPPVEFVLLTIVKISFTVLEV